MAEAVLRRVLKIRSISIVGTKKKNFLSIWSQFEIIWIDLSYDASREGKWKKNNAKLCTERSIKIPLNQVRWAYSSEFNETSSINSEK